MHTASTPTSISVLLCTTPSTDVAEVIAHALLIDGLCACVTMVTGVRSMYVWDGKLEQTSEVQLIIKTAERCVTQVISRITSLHPYDVPEIIAIPVVDGLPAYLDWINSVCSRPTDRANDSFA